MEPFIPWIIVLACVALVIFLVKFLKDKKADGKQAAYISNTLREAKELKAAFDLKLMSGEQHAVLTAVLAQILPGKLKFQVKSPISQDWSGGITEAYFRVGHDDIAVFYVFTSRILGLENTPESHNLLLAFPDHLRVEKKRHFLRVQPNQKDILMLAVWPMLPGQRLPVSSDDISSAPFSWKSGNAEKNLAVANISGSGIAITFKLHESGELPGLPMTTGKQILCLLICRTDEKSPTSLIFWCAAEIKNIRKTQASVTLGLEFTNTAIQQQGSPELHWTHASPWRGVKPVIKWVEQIDRNQN